MYWQETIIGPEISMKSIKQAMENMEYADHPGDQPPPRSPSPPAAPAWTRHALTELATPPPGPDTLVSPARTTRPGRRSHPGQLAIGACLRIRAFARRVRAGRGCGPGRRPRG